MHWRDKLDELFEDVTLSKVSEKLGFSKNRLYVIVKEGQCPNAVDAVKICRYLKVSVEDVFGETAQAELAELRALKPPTVAEANRAAARAVAEGVAAARGRVPPASAKGKGKARKSG